MTNLDYPRSFDRSPEKIKNRQEPLKTPKLLKISLDKITINNQIQYIEIRCDSRNIPRKSFKNPECLIEYLSERPTEDLSNCYIVVTSSAYQAVVKSIAATIVKEQYNFFNLDEKIIDDIGKLGNIEKIRSIINGISNKIIDIPTVVDNRALLFELREKSGILVKRFETPKDIFEYLIFNYFDTLVRKNTPSNLIIAVHRELEHIFNNFKNRQKIYLNQGFSRILREFEEKEKLSQGDIILNQLQNI